jgi:hypothetical protein
MKYRIDPSIRRVVVGTFQFPLGSYPVEEMTPRAGYVWNFEQADAGEHEDMEEWPDRYMFEAVLSHHRLPTLMRSLLLMFPGRVFPILDILGQDAFREIDPFMAYDPVGLDVMLDGVREFGEYLYEDGLCGFGAMSEEPFLYVFLDEHKIVTIRAEPSLKERIEKLLQAFDLEQREDIAGADATAHEHRSVLLAPAEHPDFLAPEEIHETLRDRWRLVLNIDPESNIDDEGTELGTTAWRCVVRVLPDEEHEKAPPRYAEVFLDADNLRQAEEVAFSAVKDLDKDGFDEESAALIVMDRLRPEHLRQWLKSLGVGGKGGKHPGGQPTRGSSRKRKSGKADQSTPKAAKQEDLHTTEALHEHARPAAGRVYYCRWLAAG